jgi:hypothetical protein
MGHSVWKEWGPTKAFGEHDAYGRATYSDITGPGGHLAHLEPFEGNSMRATMELVQSVYVHDMGLLPLPPEEWRWKYTVYSYSEPIARVELPSEGDKANGRDLYRTYWLNHRKYSPITSKHQGYTRIWLGHATHLREVDA